MLAGNIANADTPNYKARDFDFSAALASAVNGRGGAGLVLSRTAEGHLGGSAGTGVAALQYRQTAQGAIDGNTVDMDVERSQFAENAVHYEAGLTFITHQFKLLQAALQSQ